MKRTRLGFRLYYASAVLLLTWTNVAYCDWASESTDIPVQKRLEALGKKSIDAAYRFSKGNTTSELRYRLFVPTRLEAAKSYPLIVWLHGAGDRGTDNLSHMRHFDTTVYPGGNTNCSFYLFALQCSGKAWIGTDLKFDDDMLSAMLEVLDQLQKTNPIDADRVTVVGISAGGTACWELLKRYPERFAAVAPLSAIAMTGVPLTSMTRTPIWAFHAASDRDDLPGMEHLIAEINNAGGRAYLTITNGMAHDSWTPAFNDHDLRNWLLAQRRNSKSPAPGSHTLFVYAALVWKQYWSNIAGFAMLFSLAGICYWAIKSRKTLQDAPRGTDHIASLAETGHKLSGGFTLVEVLVVIAIIGVLVALSLPAVEMAREASRRSTCANNLRQQAMAVRLHEQAHKIFPTGGWKNFLGNPDAGYGPKQPGGWIYNVLTYIEQDNLRQLGLGLTGAARDQALVTLMQSPVEIFYCPSRRLARLYPYTAPPLQNAKPPLKVAKTDYAISSIISYEKSEVIMPDIQLRGKGASKTVLAAEKSISAEAYDVGGPGDAQVAYVGDSEDIRRSASGTPVPDKGGGSGFGGPHPGGANVAYCDGSVRFVRDEEAIEP